MLQDLLRLWPGQDAHRAAEPEPKALAAEPKAPSASDTARPAAVPAQLLIDVRTEREFAQCAVVGAVNLPLSQLDQRIGTLAADTATPLVLYCASGARSGVACQMLRQMGYGNVSNAGGLYAAAARLQLGLR